MKPTVHQIVAAFVAALVGCGGVGAGRPAMRSDEICHARIAFEAEVRRQVALLEEVTVELPTNVPLKLFPLLHHVNARLSNQGVSLQVRTYWKQPLASSDWRVAKTIPELGEMSYFSADTEDGLRKEINDHSMNYLLHRMKLTYGLSLICLDRCILLTPSIAEPHEFAGQMLLPTVTKVTSPPVAD
jgi:phosphoglycolate phosphatase-like HAD superfamily hydrolase